MAYSNRRRTVKSKNPFAELDSFFKPGTQKHANMIASYKNGVVGEIFGKKSFERLEDKFGYKRS